MGKVGNYLARTKTVKVGEDEWVIKPFSPALLMKTASELDFNPMDTESMNKKIQEDPIKNSYELFKDIFIDPKLGMESDDETNTIGAGDIDTATWTKIINVALGNDIMEMIQKFPAKNVQ